MGSFIVNLVAHSIQSGKDYCPESGINVENRCVQGITHDSQGNEGSSAPENALVTLEFVD